MQADLIELTKTLDADRDHLWENRFLQAISKANLSILVEEPQLGPDGWPYLTVETTIGATEKFSQILHWCTEKGVGLVVNPYKGFPDYVFPYGMLWSFRETGWFFINSEAKFPEIKKDFKKIEIAESALPIFARKILLEFLGQQGVQDPEIMMFQNSQGAIDVCFPAQSLGSPPESEHQGILKAISWFMPPHYGTIISVEQNLPFTRLKLTL